MRRHIYEEASQWLVELRVGEPEALDRARLDAWFRTSPEHIRAFLELASIWEQSNDPELDRLHTTEDLVALARASSSIVPWQPTAAQASGAAPSDSLRSRWRKLAGAVAASALVAVVLFAWYAYPRSTYETGTGEQSTVHLSDGSTLELNSRSRVRIRFSERAREIDLVDGQAMFQVAKEAARPFIVWSDSTRVRALGTQFDVYRKSSGTVVTVVEGKVDVLADSATTVRGGGASVDGVAVAAGEQVRVASSAIIPTLHANVAGATAWTRRELSFDAAPLTEVVEEFNRHNARQLIVSDAALGKLHVTGVFSSTDPTSLLRFLRAQDGVRVEETAETIHISTSQE